MGLAAVERGDATAEPLREQIGQWSTFRGTVQAFRPLSAGAAWGEGTLVTGDGERLPLSAPVSLGLADGAVATLLARVAADEGGVRIIAARSTEAPEGPAAPAPSPQ